MAGAVQAGALVVDMSVETAKVKANTAENVRTIEGGAQKMAEDLKAIRKGFEDVLDPLKGLTVKVGSLESNIDKAKAASFSLAKGLILGAAAGMSIDAIKGKVMGVIDSMAALKTQSEKTGSSVGNLSKIGFFSKQAGSDIDTVIGAMNKMSKGMAGADDETKGAGAALAYLGLKARDAAGNLKDPSAMLTEISQKMAGYKDGAGKVALAQTLWGKSGADMLPTLKLMAEYGDITAKTTDEQATSARQYQRDLAKLEAQKGILFKTIAVSLLPTMSDFTNAMIDATKNTNLTNGAVKGLADDHSITDWADAGAMGLARLLDVIILIPKTLSAATAGTRLSMSVLKAVPDFLPGGMQSGAVIDKELADIRKAAAGFADATDKMWNYEGNAMEKAMAARIAARAKLRASDAAAAAASATTENGKPSVNFKPPDEAAAAAALAAALKLSKADLDARLNLEKTANARNAAIRKEGLADMAELNRQGLASDTQLYVAKYNAALAAGNDIAAVKAAEIAILKNYNGKDAAEKRAANGKIDVLEKERVEALRAASAEAEALRTQYIFDSDKPAREAKAAADAEITATYKQIDVLKDQYAAYGLLPEAITAINIAKLEKRAIDLEENNGSEEEISINQRKLVSLRALADQQKKNSTQERGGDVAQAKELLDIMTALDEAAKSAASGMTSAFGAVGSAVGGLTTALTGYERAQAAIAAQLASATKDAYGDPTKIAKAQAAAAQQGAQAQIKSYGDMTGAAKGFFKENSAGYRAMEGAEKAYRAVEMAMAIESMVKKLFAVEVVTTATVGAEATKAIAIQAGTATQLAADTVKGTSAAAVAVATQAQGDPYSAWVRMAAMAAAMAALGFAISGGGGADTTAKDRQAATGTGTVLGDSSAKSESIAHSLAIMEKNSGLGLAYSASMSISLRQVVAGIGGLSGLLVRNAGVTGTVAPDSYGAAQNLFNATLGKIPLIGGILGKVGGGILGSIFGGKTTTLDTGLTLSRDNLQNIARRGVSASQYTDTKTSGGWFSKDRNDTALNGLGAEANGQFAKIILGLRDTVQSSATALGLGGDTFNARLQSFVVDLGKISLKDLKGDEIQKALEAAFSKLGDDMAKFGVSGLERYQKVGEAYLETLTRVANNYMQVTDVLAVLGKSFSMAGLEAVALSEHLIEVSGGIEKLTSGTGFFVQNFLTEAERMAPITKSVNEAMGKLGLAGVTTVDGFKAAVLSAADGVATGKAGAAELYASLLALAEPFKNAADYAADLAAATGEYAAVVKTASEIATEHRDLQQQLNELTKSETELLAIQRAGIANVNKALFDQVQAAKAVVSAKDALAKAYDTESTAAKAALDKSKSWVTTLNGLNASLALGSQSTLTPEQKYAEARAQFEKTLAAANAGDATAQSGLSAAEQAFLTASQVVNASDAKYAADYARVMAANDEALKWAGAQVDVQQASLDALKAQVSGLITINDSVLTVAQAIAKLQAAMGVAGGLGVKFDGSHAGGLANVPFDGYAAELHQGEVVVDAQAASAMRRYFGGAPSQGGGNTDALVAEIKGLREEVKGLRADQAKQTGATIQANQEANANAAKTVVNGVEKSSKKSAWNNRVEYAE